MEDPDTMSRDELFATLHVEIHKNSELQTENELLKAEAKLGNVPYKETIAIMAENEKLKEDRDLWKESEAQCSKMYNELLVENEQLKRAEKKAFWDGFEISRMNPDSNNILYHWTSRQTEDLSEYSWFDTIAEGIDSEMKTTSDRQSKETYINETIKKYKENVGIDKPDLMAIIKGKDFRTHQSIKEMFEKIGKEIQALRDEMDSIR